MKAEPEFDLVEFVRFLDKNKIRYLLIGRWAVILHGAPLVTADYDFWISNQQKSKLLSLLIKMDWEIPDRNHWNDPIVTVYCGPDSIDLFFHRSITNVESTKITFDECWKRSVVRRDEKTRFSLRLPGIDDLIALKKIKRSNPSDTEKDRTDIRFLESLRK